MSLRQKVIASVAAAVIVLGLGVVTTFTVVGCGDGVVAAAATQYKTPGVYIVSAGPFGGQLVSVIRGANPTCA